MEMEQPAPSQATCATFPSLTARRKVTSSPQTGLSWCDWPVVAPSGASVPASPLPWRALEWSRMICWYSWSRLMVYLQGGVLGAEIGAHAGDGFEELVHVVGGVVQVGARPGGGRQPQPAVQRLCTVVAHPDGDAPRIQELPHIVGVHPVHVERGEADAVLPRGW